MEVEFSDNPELGPLTVVHLMSLFFIHGLFLAIATLVWLGELLFGFIQKRTNHAAWERGSVQMMQDFTKSTNYAW